MSGLQKFYKALSMDYETHEGDYAEALHWWQKMWDKVEFDKKFDFKKMTEEIGPTSGHKMEWISVKDRMPDIDQEVLAWNGQFIEKAHRTCDDYNLPDQWYWTYYDYMEWCDVTHWMPLPKPPEE